jgi:hypothetical protein
MLYGTHAASLPIAAATFADLVQASDGAWSLKLINPDYTGECIRVVRSSDSAESDFGFSSGVIDAAAILSWLAGADGRVTTWYDQSGNGLNLTQTTLAAMPWIAAGGSMYTGESGKYMMRTDGSNKLVTTTTAWIELVPYTFSSVIEFSGLAASNQYAGTDGTAGTNDKLQLGVYYAGNKLTIGQWNNDHNSTADATANTTQAHTIVKYNAGGSRMYVDGTEFSYRSTKPSSTHLQTTVNEFAVFAGGGSKYFDNNGLIGEVIAFGSTVSAADLETLWTEQITNWNI